MQRLANGWATQLLPALTGAPSAYRTLGSLQSVINGKPFDTTSGLQQHPVSVFNTHQSPSAITGLSTYTANTKRARVKNFELQLLESPFFSVRDVNTQVTFVLPFNLPMGVKYNSAERGFALTTPWPIMPRLNGDAIYYTPYRELHFLSVEQLQAAGSRIDLSSFDYISSNGDSLSGLPNDPPLQLCL